MRPARSSAPEMGSIPHSADHRGKPVVRRGRKARGLARETAQLPAPIIPSGHGPRPGEAIISEARSVMDFTRAGVALAAITGALALPAAAQAAPLYADAVLEDGPLTYLRMSEAGGTTVLQDSSPYDHDGNLSGAPVFGAPGPFVDAGTALGLAAADAVGASVPVAGDSVELWVRPSRLARNQQAGIAAHGDPSGDGWALGIGTKRKLAFKTGGVVLTSKVSLATDTWTMLDVTFTDKKVLVYRNGVLAKSLNRNGATPASTSGALVLGGNGAGAFTGSYAGGLDEVAVFPQVLTDGDVSQHFTAAHVPINTAPPTVTGDLTVGATLTAQPGSWTDGGTATYQWERCDADGEDCEDIVDATGTTYVLAAADACGTLQVAETMTNAYGTGTAVSAPTGVVAGDCVPTPPGDGTPGDGTPGTGTPGTGTPGTGTPDTGTPGTGTSAPVAQPAAAGCLRIASVRRRTRVRGLGVVKLGRVASGCLATPLRASVRAKRGVKLGSVRFRLDGKRLARAKRPRFRVQVAPAALTAGSHKLVVKLRPRGGKPRRAV